MDFALTEELEMLKTGARTLLSKEYPETVIRKVEKDGKGYSPELWQTIAELGWLGLPFPEKYGGTGGDLFGLAVLFEEMGRARFTSPYLSTVVLCGLTILAAGSEEQKSEILPKIAEGKLILALALTEPESGWEGNAWEADGVALQALADGDDYIIDGTKLFVHDAQVADYLLCVTRTGTGTTPDKGITLFLVDTKSPGIDYTRLKTTGNDTQYEAVFNKVKVPKSNIIGELDKGWEPLSDSLKKATVLICAEMAGGGQKLLELTVDYAKTRIQFDLPIGINQYIQEHCCEIVACADGCKWVTYQAIWKLNENMPCDIELAIAKAWTGEAYEKLCWHTHQVFAGAGYSPDEGIIPFYSLRGKSLQLYLGDTTYHRKQIAKQFDNWTYELPKGKPLGLWNTLQNEQTPDWEALIR